MFCGATGSLAVRLQIRDQECLAIDRMSLNFAGNVLRDGHTLSDYNVESGATLDLVVLPLWIVVRTPRKRIKINGVSFGRTVGDVKAMIQRRLVDLGEVRRGARFFDWHFSFGDRELEVDSNTLSAEGVGHGAVLSYGPEVDA